MEQKTTLYNEYTHNAIRQMFCHLRNVLKCRVRNILRTRDMEYTNNTV